jgi:hypothetical protein
VEDSLKGILVTITIIGLFMTAILNFIILFPQEQGVIFTDSPSANDYLTISQVNIDSGASLSLINNQSTDAFNQWDITTGFMGSNQIKQGQGGITKQMKSLFSNLKILATQVFGSGSPIIYTLGILLTLSIIYLGYALYKFVRTGL